MHHAGSLAEFGTALIVVSRDIVLFSSLSVCMLWLDHSRSLRGVGPDCWDLGRGSRCGGGGSVITWLLCLNWHSLGVLNIV